MPLTTYASVCTSKSLLASGVYEFRLTKPAGFAFVPGQFILFAVPMVGKPQDVQTRAFSIASAPHEDDLLFVAKMIPGGRASRWIEEEVAPGVDVTFTGPFGRFVLDPRTEKEYLFVATSTGVAPFRSMVLDALFRGGHSPALAGSEDRRMDLVFGVRSEADLFWHAAFGELAKRHGNFFFHVALSQPSSSWTGHRGRVQAVTPGIVGNDFGNKSLYVCGSPAMTADVKMLALTAWGMEKGNVHAEGYI